jgi:hypothetical protein
MLKTTGTFRGLGIVLALAMFSACGKQSIEEKTDIPGIHRFQLQIANGNASLAVAFESLETDAGAVIPLQRPRGASIEIGPDFQSNGTLFKISVPLASLFDGGNGLQQAGLPDGRPIPFIRDGHLGAIAVNLPVFGTTYFYLANDVFGMFIPANLPDFPLMISTKIRDDRGNVLGILAGIPRGSVGAVSGILFLFPIDGGL